MSTSPQFGRGTRQIGRALLLGASFVALAAGQAAADGPKGGKVVTGEAGISQSAKRSVISQKSKRAVIDWQGFDVGRDHTVVFDQPGRSAATLNRVTTPKPSTIRGAIEAPGTVIIQNGAGVIFTGSARVDTGGLVATSQSVDAARFQADGGLRIGGGEAAGARVLNEGRITIGEAGLAALVGGNVENAGAIIADRGTVLMASGAQTAIDFTGDGLVHIAVEGTAGGEAPGVRNSGLIDVGGGRVVLTAGGAAAALDAVINTSGVIRATSGHGNGGRIELTGSGGGTVRVAGTLDASGSAGGGSVDVTGARVTIEPSARVVARGGTDGGAVRIGGDRGGIGPLRRADHLTMAAGASIAADGGSGRGGSAVLWSDGTTQVDGAISATGAAGGGFVETSGRFALGVGETARVTLGTGGAWLLDPRDVTIVNGNTNAVGPGVTTPPPGTMPYTISRNSIQSVLNAGSDVTISTAQPASTMAGDITLDAGISWNGTGALRFEADRDIRLNGNMTIGDGSFTALASRDIVVENGITAPRSGGLQFDAGRNVTVNDTIRATGPGGIAMLARTGDISITERRAGNLIVSTDGGPLSLAAPEGSVLLRRVNPLAASNVQVYSDTGPVDVSAGTRILLEGGTQGGRWVRLGRQDSASDVTLTAPAIEIRGGTQGNTFAEVVTGAGGSITMRADDIALQNGAGDQARIRAFAEAPLTLLAETQTWNGPVTAGTGNRDGGEVLVAGAIDGGLPAAVQPRPRPQLHARATHACGRALVLHLERALRRLDCGELAPSRSARRCARPRSRWNRKSASARTRRGDRGDRPRRFRGDRRRPPVPQRRRCRRADGNGPLAPLHRQLRRPRRPRAVAARLRSLRPLLRRHAADRARLRRQPHRLRRGARAHGDRRDAWQDLRHGSGAGLHADRPAPRRQRRDGARARAHRDERRVARERPGRRLCHDCRRDRLGPGLHARSRRRHVERDAGRAARGGRRRPPLLRIGEPGLNRRHHRLRARRGRRRSRRRARLHDPGDASERRGRLRDHALGADEHELHHHLRRRHADHRSRYPDARHRRPGPHLRLGRLRRARLHRLGLRARAGRRRHRGRPRHGRHAHLRRQQLRDHPRIARGAELRHRPGHAGNADHRSRYPDARHRRPGPHLRLGRLRRARLHRLGLRARAGRRRHRGRPRHGRHAHLRRRAATRSPKDRSRRRTTSSPRPRRER
jgi:filamentous hemagglutinin family protein